MIEGARRTLAQRRGAAAETRVAERLERAGWTILGRNVRAGRAELDLLAIDPGPPAALVVVEVRFRTTRAFGLAEESVDRRKRQRLHAAFSRLRETGALPDGTPLPRLAVRFDVIAVEPVGGGGSGSVTIRHHRYVA